MGGAAYDWFWKKMNGAMETRPLSEEQIRAQAREANVRQQMSQANIVDSLWFRIKASVGLCTPTAGQLSEYLEKAEQHARRAKNLAEFATLDPELGKSLESSAEAISKVHAHLEKTSNISGDIRAACTISEAVATLNAWASDPHGDTRAAAAAFDKLFGGVARYAEKLPAPINSYARILEQVSISGFFSNMHELGQSRVGGNTRTPTGRQMKEVMDELDRQAAGR